MVKPPRCNSRSPTPRSCASSPWSPAAPPPRPPSYYRVNLAFVFHAIELGLTRAAYCKTTVQRADFLTKALPVGAFRAAAAFVYPGYESAKL